ncbi:MAG: type II toxin-antitoxin system Phd/YefM family antitoxin [Terriglobales bacterium]
MEVNVHEAKTHLSRLLRQVAAGDEITISRAGVPVAKLIAAGARRTARPMGMDRGKIWMADDFDRPDPELEALFYGPITTEAREEIPAPPKRKKKA